MMMLLRTAVLSLLLTAACSAPAIVWKASSELDSTASVHTSEEVTVTDLLSELTGTGVSVVFLLARGESGRESLTVTAPLLHQVSAKQQDAAVTHHHVSGILSGAGVVNEAGRALPGHFPLLISLPELALKLNASDAAVEVDGTGGIMSKTAYQQSKRARALAHANLLVVDVGAARAAADVAALDAAVAHAIASAGVANVVLSAVRGVEEVKREREMLARRRLVAQERAGHSSAATQGQRRLAADDANGGASYSSDLTGVYYVAMTPNLLAGVLFFFLFSTVTWIGISCMGMIAGQDLYVTKMPSIGREA